MKMSMQVKLMFMAFIALMAVLHVKAQQPLLQCWHCSSDTIGAEDFCGDEFQEDNIPVESLKERNLSVLRICNSTIKSDHVRPVCRKTIEDVNGKQVVKRFCYYANKSDTAEACMQDPKEKNVNRLYCGDCWTDKCNGVSSLMIGGHLAASWLLSAIIFIGFLKNQMFKI